LASSTEARSRLPWCFSSLPSKAVEQGEGVGGAAGETDQDLALVDLAHLAGRALHDDIAQRNLAVAAERDFLAAAYAQDGGAVKLFHSDLKVMMQAASRLKSGA
jgi:hypothetical protein